MNSCFAAAGVLAFVIGLVHSVLGERLIFRRMRGMGFIPTKGGQILREAHVRILWVSWHLVTVFGWGLAVVLFWLAHPSAAQLSQSMVAKAILACLLCGSALVLVGTRGRHPGWVGLLLAAILTMLGMYA